MKRRVTDETIRRVLKEVLQAGGTQAEAARRVGLSEGRFSDRLKALGLRRPRGRGRRRRLTSEGESRADVWPEGFLQLLRGLAERWEDPAELLHQLGRFVREYRADCIEADRQKSLCGCPRVWSPAKLAQEQERLAALTFELEELERNISG